MPELLVAAKSKRQRTAEGWLILILPCVISVSYCGLLGHPSFVASVLAALIFYGIGPVGNILARYGEGERITREERYNRMLETIASVPLWRSLAWTSLAYFFLFVAIFLPLSRTWDRSILSFIVEVAAAGALVASLCGILATRMQRARLHDPSLSEDSVSVAVYLRKTIPFYYFCFGVGTALGWLVSRQLSLPLSAFAFLACFWGALLLHQFVRARWPAVRVKPILWHHLRFGQVVLFGVFNYAIPFAFFFPLVALAIGGADNAPIVLVAAAGGGFAFGLALCLIFWTLSRLNDLSAKAEKS